MPPDSTPASGRSDLLDRARALLQRTTLAVVPLAAASAASAQVVPSLGADYSVVGSFTNSGWFTGVFMNDADASLSAAGQSAQLGGAHTIDDGLFWQWSDYYQQTVPGYDTTGMRFAWGGPISGTLMSGDTLTANLNFTLTFSHTSAGQYDTPNVSYDLYVGYRGDPYTPEAYASSPTSSAFSSNSTSGSLDTAGTFDLGASTSVTLGDSTDVDAKYWFALLEINWSNEFVSASHWNGSYAKLNGDELSVSFAPGSSVALASSVTAVPEPASVGFLAATAAALVALWRRRRPA